MPLNLVWQCANIPEPLLERGDFAGGGADALLAAGLLREEVPAQHVSCASCAETTVCDVYSDRDDPAGTFRHTAYCPEHGRFSVSPSDLSRYRLDFAPMIRCLAVALDMKSRPEERIPGRLWRLGQKKYRNRPYYFWAVLGAHWIGRHALPADALPGAGVVFTVGDDDAAAFDPNVTLARLRDVVTWENGGLRADAEACRQLTLSASGGDSPATARPRPVRGARLDVIDRAKDFVLRHIRDQKELYYDSEANGYSWKYTPLPNQKDMAKMLGVTESRLSRAIRERRDPVLKILLEAAQTERCLFDSTIGALK